MKFFRLLVLLIILLPTIYVSAQTVSVFDRQTGKPVPDVLLYNESKTTTIVTNQDGKADISVFHAADTVLFRHPSYYTVRFKYGDILKKHNKILLDERLIDLDEIVVSANSWEVNKSEVPNQIEAVKYKEIVFNNPATSADMLAGSGEVFVQKSQLAGGSPMIRGFAANKILFVTDGVRMNNAIYRSGNLQNILQADVNSIENAEIIFGPGTNIYGSDALGGVMDIHIQRPVLNNLPKWKVSGQVFARTSSAAFEKTGHLKLNIANNKWGFLTLLSFTGFDDLRMGAHGDDFYLRNEYVTRINGKDSIVPNDNNLVQKFSGYNQFNLTQKIKYNIDNQSSLNVNFYYSGTSEAPRYDRLIQYKHHKLKYAEWYYKPQQWLMGSVRYINHKKSKLADNYKLTLAYQNVKEGRNDRKYQKEWLRERVETVNVVSFNLDFDKSLKNQQFLYYGGEFFYNHVASNGEKININSQESKAVATRYPDGGTDYMLGGLYLTYKNNFNMLPLTLQAGARLSWSYLNASFVDTSWYHLPYTEIVLNNGALTGNIGLVYHPETWKISINLSSGFRAPNLDDVAKVFDSEPGNVVVPNEGLKPEYLYNIDLTTEKTFGDFLKLEATGFYSYLVDAMVRRDFTLNGADSMMYDGEMSKIQAIVNTGYAYIYGVSGRMLVQFNRYSGFNTKLTWIKGFDGDNYPLRHVSPFFMNASLFFEVSRLRLAVTGVYNGEISYNNLAPSERDKTHLYAKDQNGNPYAPSWWALNFRGSYAFSPAFLLTAGVENILDKRYRPYSSGISAPGINFVLALRVTF
jgi:hemoglobin/transferrin/lactoferrin receptor protein